MKNKKIMLSIMIAAITVVSYTANAQKDNMQDSKLNMQDGKMHHMKGDHVMMKDGKMMMMKDGKMMPMDKDTKYYSYNSLRFCCL